MSPGAFFSDSTEQKFDWKYSLGAFYSGGLSDTASLNTTITHQLTDITAFSYRIPFLNLKGSALIRAVEKDFTVSGLGDILIKTDFTLLGRPTAELTPPFSLRFGIGCFLPTGRSNVAEGPQHLPIELQPGSGTLRPVISMDALRISTPVHCQSDCMEKLAAERMILVMKRLPKRDSGPVYRSG